MAFASFILMPGVLFAGECEAMHSAFQSGCGGVVLVQSQPWSSGSRGYSRPPPPAPRSSNSGTVVLPRVPYDNRLDDLRTILFSANGCGVLWCAPAGFTGSRATSSAWGQNESHRVFQR